MAVKPIVVCPYRTKLRQKSGEEAGVRPLASSRLGSSLSYRPSNQATISIKCVSVGQRELTCHAHMLQSFNQHSNVERAQCAVSTRGSRPMKDGERVKERGHEEGRGEIG